MIGIRADANREIGLGHVMRCLSIADALRAEGQQVCFILADNNAEELLKGRGQEYHILNSAYNRMEEELEDLQKFLKEKKIGLFLIDSYQVTENYLARLKSMVKTIYMDDIPKFAYPVDGIINYNIYGGDMPYQELTLTRNGQKEPKLWLGPAYAPLREQFQGIDYKFRPVAENVLITTGGSDKYNLAGSILEAVLTKEDTAEYTRELHYHVVSGAFNPNYHFLEEMAGKYPNIHLYQNVTNMAELMEKCDVAITAGGSTMYELCAVGVPIICFSFVDNQELIVENFYKKNLVAYGGNYLKEKEAFSGNVARALTELVKDEKLRQEFSRKARQLVDGQGAERIAAALCECL